MESCNQALIKGNLKFSESRRHSRVFVGVYSKDCSDTTEKRYTQPQISLKPGIAQPALIHRKLRRLLLGV